MFSHRLRYLVVLALGLATIAPLSAGERWDRVKRTWSTPYPVAEGSRMHEHSGKQWPPYPRPVGEPEPFMHRYHSVHYWPYPYLDEDRCSIRMALEQQTQAGWVAATTLYDSYFDAETNELNQAGRGHLRWIMQYAPPSRRTAFVAAADSPTSSQTRLASVQSEAAVIAAGGQIPPIMLRTCQSVGTSAEIVDRVHRSYIESTPTPRIPLTGTASSTSQNASSGTSTASPSPNFKP
jgi:hypothetical protein